MPRCSTVKQYCYPRVPAGEALRSVDFLDRKHIERFWLNVDRGRDSDCWLWRGSKNIHGYGKLSVKHAGLAAHRVAFYIEYGPIPEGLCVLHSCDVPHCVNPRHLHLGTNSDNTQEALARGRLNICGDNNWQRRHPERILRGEGFWAARGYVDYGPKGSDHGMAKLTEDQVQGIRGLLRQGVLQKDIAHKYGVTFYCISDIKRRKTWGHLADPTS